MSELKAHDATIASTIDAGFGYRAVVTKLAESGIHVKPNTMKDYMKRVFRSSLRVPMISKDALDSSQIDNLRNLCLSLPGASASLVQARLRDGYCLALSLKDIRYYIDQFRLESISSSGCTRLPRMRGKQRSPPHLSLTQFRPLAIKH